MGNYNSIFDPENRPIRSFERLFLALLSYFTGSCLGPTPKGRSVISIEGVMEFAERWDQKRPCLMEKRTGFKFSDIGTRLLEIPPVL
jgi:hypothetical protein